MNRAPRRGDIFIADKHRRVVETTIKGCGHSPRGHKGKRMNDTKLTTASEIGAYLAAHVVGLMTTYLVNPIIFAMLISSGRQASIPVVALGISLLTMFGVLLLFLVMRKLLGGEPL
jgi:hypothetical protein